MDDQIARSTVGATSTPYPEINALPPVLEAKEVAAFFKVSTSYVHQLVRAGRIARIPVGQRRTLIPREEVRRLLMTPVTPLPPDRHARHLDPSP